MIFSDLKRITSVDVNDKMKLHSSIKASVKATNLKHSMESFVPIFVPVQLVSVPTMPRQQSIPESCLLDYQINQICCLKGQKEGSTFAFPELLNCAP
ncbi:hypothetical protein ACTXT7_013451 [Hymenolepis weldensis]